jgi:lipoprotein-anchoring transpeptidase ErfK/SrfK
MVSPAWAAARERAGAAGEVKRSSWYIGKIPDQPFDIRIVDKLKIPSQFHRQSVTYTGDEATGTLVIDKSRKFLFHVTGPSTATRYGIAVGRAGARWQGSAVIGRKAKWPGWTPTDRMRERDPSLPLHMPGGPRNPLGARALYLYRNGRDTLYRIHGTNEPWSIGRAASSGCIRMLNEHIFELYADVGIGTPVVVL